MSDDLQTGKCPCCHVENPDPAGFVVALQDALALKQKLQNSPNWFIRVHHNIQWYYSLHGFGGRLTISGDPKNGYSTFFSWFPDLGDDPEFCIPGPVTPSEVRDPYQLVKMQIRQIKSVLERKVELSTFLLDIIKKAGY